MSPHFRHDTAADIMFRPVPRTHSNPGFSREVRENRILLCLQNLQTRRDEMQLLFETIVQRSRFVTLKRLHRFNLHMSQFRLCASRGVD